MALSRFCRDCGATPMLRRAGDAGAVRTRLRADIGRHAGHAIANRFRGSRACVRMTLTGLTQKRYKLLSVLVIGAVVDVMFTDNSDAFLKPDIFQSAAAEMAGKNVNGSRILHRQER